MCVGIDVGGANTKFATPNGTWDIIHLPLWQHADLEGTLDGIRKAVEAMPAGVVMTGELADCFSSRREGVVAIARACASVLDEVYFFSLDGRFYGIEGVMASPLSFAAANWMASAMLVAESHPSCVLVDMGSTTTDIIPIVDGRVRAHTTDLERLAAGELVYTGMVRTSVCALVRAVELDGIRVPLAKEVFATMADVHTVLGCDVGVWSTADGRGTSREECMQRLARCVCADADEFEKDTIVDMALQIKEAQLAELTAAMRKVLKRHPASKVVACGIGEPLIAEVAHQLGIECHLCSAQYGDVSHVLPAYATGVLLKRWLR